jgi:citronellol/citronellal dehydrogenase
MNKIKNNVAYVLKSIKKDRTLKPAVENLKGRTYIVSGASRGIGYNIAKKLALQGANVTITGKTEVAHPKLEGTIYSAEEKITEATQKPNCMAVPCDIRNPNDIDLAVSETLDVYGRIDGVILNASALCLNSTLNQTQKEIDLMTGVNIRGTFTMGQKCLQHIQKSDHGSVLTIAPPIQMLYEDDWWVNHLYYSMSKFNMSLMAKYWNKEFPNVAVNTLWPRTTIATAPVRNLLGGEEMINISRIPDIMGDAATHIIKADPKKCTGKNFIDDEVIASMDEDVEKYRVNNEIKEKELMPDFFC